MTNDSVVLADADGRPCGTADREGVHGFDTPLHFAFSCHLVVDGRILMTRRALSKRSWPGVWTNSFCGHPRPGEDVVDAVHRYARRELGIEVADVRCILPDFRYRAVDASAPWAVSPWFVEQVRQLPAPDHGSVYDTHPVMSRASNS